MSKKNTIEIAGSEAQTPAVTLEDYVVIEKATAFTRAYDPSPTEQEADEIWNEARIRAFFGAYVEKTHGDTLPIYLEQLRLKGFVLKVASTGELTLWLQYKREADPDILRMLNGTDSDVDQTQESLTD